MPGRFEVVTRSSETGARVGFFVVDSQDDHRPVAEFDDRDDAQRHADKLNAGPLDWDEQEAWQDDWEDDWGDGDR